MQQDNTFQGGLQQDPDPQFQPANTYRDALHLVRTAGGHLQQERVPLVLARRPALPVVGGCSLNGEEILFSTDGITAEVGVQREQDYAAILTSAALALGPQVSCTAHVDYRDHRLVYWGDEHGFYKLDLDEVPLLIPEGLRVLPNPSLPEIAVTGADHSGELATGVYLASVSLVTASKNVICYSPFTAPCPIVDEVPAGGRSVVDGAPPQTPATGSISFRLSNLDGAYAYAQLVVATYLGTGNQLALYRLPLIPLNGRTALDYTYYSASQHLEPVDLAETLSTLADFEQAGCLLQKDGRLLAANVRVRPADPVDWQAIANRVQLGPAIREVPYLEAAATDYKDPLLSVDGKGLQRDEVYSFCLVPVVRGRRLDAYHIPGVATHGGAVPTGVFAPYFSQEPYPADSALASYQADAVQGRLIRHHRMPSVAEQPLVSGATAAGATLRVLGVREVLPPDFSGLSAAQRADLDGYYIGLQPRTPGNRSVLAQGIAQPLVPIQNGYHAVSAFAGKWPASRDDAAAHAKGTGEYAAFYSAESDIVLEDMTGATRLQCVARLDGESLLAGDHREDEIQNRYAYAFLDLHDYANSAAGGDIALTAVANARIQPADDYASPIGEGALSIYTWQQNGYTLLRANLSQAPNGFYTGLPDNQPDLEYNNRSDATDEIYLRQANGTRPNQDDAQRRGVAWRYLYSLVRPRNRQYGALEQATYYPACFRRTGAGAPPFFSGDTFIGKVALQSDTTEYDNSDSHGVVFRTLSYYFCESTVNTAYRHSVSANGAALGTLPYYPRTPSLVNTAGTGVMQYSAGLGHPTGYNKQYSFTARLNPLLPKDGTLPEVTSFRNRIYYSQQAVEGEQLDAFRIFRANDYHDIPKGYGPITALWDWENKLYVHTSGALYHSFFNEATTTATSEGEVYLGNGGLFPRPSQPVLTLEGGFAGCQHPAASVSTPIGRFFPDAQGRRVYLFNGQLQELSRDGMRDYFQQQLSNYVRDLVGCYDNREERYLLYGLQQGGVSWSARNQHWASFHAQVPVRALTTQRRVLLELSATPDTGDLQELGQGFGYYDASLTTITNAPAEESKVFDNVQVHASHAPDEVQQNTRTQGTTLRPTEQLTAYGQLPAAGSVLLRQANDQHQYPVSRDFYTGGTARLKGKWLSTLNRWRASAVPALIRQVTVLFRQSYR